VDWQKNKKEMARLAKERGVNRKVTSALKGSWQSLGIIDTPKFDWHYSATKAELYNYDKGSLSCMQHTHLRLDSNQLTQQSSSHITT